MNKTLEELRTETIEHRNDVIGVILQISNDLIKNASCHDVDKFTNLGCLQKALETKDFIEWDKYHMMQQRHHKEWQFLNQDKVNLIDLLETCADGATACFRRNPNNIATFESQKTFYEKAWYDSNLSTILANTFMICYDKIRGEQK